MPRQLDANLVTYMKTVSSMMPKRPGMKYGTFEGFYLTKGRTYPHAPYTKDEEKAILAGIIEAAFVPAMKQCFFNSQRLALMGRFSYAEGYALADDLPISIHHAWAVYHGKPVDITLRRSEDKEIKDPVGLLARASRNLMHVAYHGIEFSKSVISSIWQKEKTARSVVDDWKHGFPLMRG